MFSTSVSISDDTIKEIDIETKGTMFPHMCIRLESGPYVYIYATDEQLQQIAQAITTWSETQQLPAINAG